MPTRFFFMQTDTHMDLDHGNIQMYKKHNAYCKDFQKRDSTYFCHSHGERSKYMYIRYRLQDKQY